LTIRKRARISNDSDGEDGDREKTDSGANSETAAVELTEDQKAIKALLSSADGNENEEEEIAAIPLPVSGTSTPASLAEREKAAYHRDVADLPEPATLDAYERIPVSQFGAALLRGMGWKEGQAASRTRKGPVEPWLPTQRPQLLGIGAKEREVLDDGSDKKASKKRQESKKYMPLMKVEKGSSSSRDKSSEDRGRREYDRDSYSKRRDSRDRDRDSRGEKEREPHRRRDDSDRDYPTSEGRVRDKDRGRGESGYRNRERDRDRDYSKYEGSERRERRDRDRDRDRDRNQGRG